MQRTAVKKDKIAIIGSGIAGLGCAYFLHDKYEVAVFEQDDRPGGHSNTVVLKEGKREVPIDTAVMIFNKANYPYFWHLLEELKVPTQRVTSTIGFQHTPSGLEYAVPALNLIFAQRRNLINPTFHRLLRDILSFGKIAPEVLTNKRYASYSVGRYLQEKGLGEGFAQKYLLPFTAALWSADPKLIMDFPIVTLVQYFDNHHLLGPRRKTYYAQPSLYAWRGIVGGTRVYRDKLISLFPDSLRLRSKVSAVKRLKQGVELVFAGGRVERFDRVILACHADDALKLLTGPTKLEKELLAPFYYKTNSVTLHTDNSVMPKNRRAWASFNSRLSGIEHGVPKVTQNYYLNPLQNLPTKTDYFLAIGSAEGVDPKTILKRFSYSHPVYSTEAAKAQKRLSELNKNGRTYFCGSYFRYAFHEDAFVSALAVCRAITGEDLWADL